MTLSLKMYYLVLTTEKKRIKTLQNEKAAVEQRVLD